jgi:endonuclease/exonuclease/phosphatase family metal-dependent hydrolase
MKVRVLTYNIHSAKGVDGVRDFSRIGNFLREQKIDVALIQEMNTLFEDRNAAEDLAFLQTDQFPFIVKAATKASAHGWYGNAILSRFPVNRHFILDITHKTREPRNIVEAFLQTPAGELHVMNTHKGLGYFERGQQMRQLGELLSRQFEVPLVVGGDINEWQVFSAGLRRLNTAARPVRLGPTFPTIYPLFALDRLWCRPANMMMSAQVLKTVETRIFSDHYPAVVEIEI